MPGQHALLSPSSSKRWLTCTPSARLEAKLKERFGDKGSSYAAEGTLAHAVAELKLRREIGEINDFNYKTQLAALEEKSRGQVPDGITKEMHRNTDYYVDTVMECYYAARNRCPDAELHIEQRLDMDRWVPRCFGTSDAVIVSDPVLYVIDYKNGAGVPVSAVDNPQARIYGLGALAAFGELYACEEVHNIIVQPKLQSVTEETLARPELLDWGESIREPAAMAWRGEGEYRTGDHCRFCAAKAICAARAAEAMSVFAHGFDAPGVIPDESIPGILKVLDTAEAWIRDIRAYAQSQALRGQQWPGYKLVRGKRPGRKWVSEDEVADTLARAGYDREQYEETRLRSCAEMEKVLGKTAFDALVGRFVTQGEAALTLVPEEDKRQEYSPADAALSDLLDD